MQKFAMLAAMGLVSCVSANTRPPIEIVAPLAVNAGAFPQTSTFSYNDILVWRALHSGKARMQNFPAHYLPGQYQITTPDSYQLPQGSEVKYYCAKGAGACEVAVFLYECSPCQTLKGGLPAHLTLSGYERTRCAPTFTTGFVGGATHKMTAFVKSIAEDTEEVVTLPGDAEFVAFGLSNGGAPQCQSLVSDVACEANTKGRCEWHPFAPSKCKLATCIQKGPSGGCDTNKCVAHEL